MTTTTEAANVNGATSPVGIYAGAVTAAPTPISDRARDYLNLDSLFTAEELAQRDKVRAFVDARIRPNIAALVRGRRTSRGRSPPSSVISACSGMHLKGYGCPGRSAVEYGLAAMELEAGDSGLRTFVSVQGSLAMSAIYKHGSEEQKQQWLPGMADGRADRLLRSDRTHRRQRPRRHDDLRPPGRDRTGC